MLYKRITWFSRSVKNNLLEGAQEVYEEAFDRAEGEHGEKERAHRVVWSAVEQKYEKNEKYKLDE